MYVMGPSAREQTISLIVSERQRQDEKWGEQNHDLPTWVTILTEEVGEMCQAFLEKDNEQTLREAIQVAAVAHAIVECFVRHGYEAEL